MIGVNYDSFRAVEKFVNAWLTVQEVVQIVLVDNFSSSEEVLRIKRLTFGRDRVSLVLRENDGYGAALNDGIEYALSNFDCENALFLFGNVDVVPVCVSLTGVRSAVIPELSIVQGGKRRPQFLTAAQRRCIGLGKLAIYTRSSLMLRPYLVVNKVLGWLPSTTWAVHGSQFALMYQQLVEVHPIFDRRVFLYCEELFFARKVERLRLPYERVPITVEHAGGVSTGAAISGSERRWFSLWRQSAKVFFESESRG